MDLDPPILNPSINIYLKIHLQEENATDKDDEFSPTCSSNEPKLFSQVELNDLVRNLALPKDNYYFL